MRQRMAIGAMVLSAAGLLVAMAGGAQADPGGLKQQIEQVQGQVTTLEGQVNNLEGQVNHLQSDDTTLEGQVNKLEGQVTSLQSNESALSTSLTAAIAALSAQISQLQTTVNGVTQPGPTLWTYYDTTAAFTACGGANADPAGCNVGGNGDNILRLINPNGSPNAVLGQSHTVCAMVYVFDDDQEMGECCGCPISSAGFATFSVLQNLTNNWALVGGPVNGEHSDGAIAIIAAATNTPVVAGGAGGNGNGCGIAQSAACNSGCDPTNAPGYMATSANNLLGTITHNQDVAVTLPAAPAFVTGLTEVNLSGDGPGDPTNLIYLQKQCGAIVGNGTGGGICNCPIE